MIIRQSIYILSIITRGVGNLKTHSPTYCIMDYIMNNWKNMLNLTHSPKYIWQAFYKFNVFRWFCIMMMTRWCTLQTNEYDLQGKPYPTICTHHKLHNNNENKFPVFPERICNKWQEYDVTNISGTKPRKNMITMGKVDTSDLMMITWAIDLSFQSPILKWASWTHTTPYIAMNPCNHSTRFPLVDLIYCKYTAWWQPGVPAGTLDKCLHVWLGPCITPSMHWRQSAIISGVVNKMWIDVNEWVKHTKASLRWSYCKLL